MCFRKGRAKKVRKSIDPYLTEVHDAFGEGGKLDYGNPVSHDTLVLLAAIRALDQKLLDVQNNVLKAIADQNEILLDLKDRLEQILRNQNRN